MQGFVGDYSAQARDRIDTWVQESQKRAEAAEEVAKQIEQMRGKAQSADGSVSVTVDAVGRLIDLSFSDRLNRVDPTRLAREVLACIGKARSRVCKDVRELAENTWGADSQITARMTRAYTTDQHAHKQEKDVDSSTPVFHAGVLRWGGGCL